MRNSEDEGPVVYNMSMRKQQDTLPDSLDLFSYFTARVYPDHQQWEESHTGNHGTLPSAVLSRHDREGAILTGPEIGYQAQTFYTAVARMKGVANPPPLNTSRCWLSKFKKCCKIKFSSYQGKSGSVRHRGSQGQPSSFEADGQGRRLL